MTYAQNINPEAIDDIPDCLRFEYLVLGKIILDNSLLETLSFLKADHFMDRYHADIFDRMHDLRNLDELIKPETLAPLVEMPGGVMRYLRMSTVDSFISDDPIELARQIVEFAKRRQLHKFFEEQAVILASNRVMSHELSPIRKTIL